MKRKIMQRLLATVMCASMIFQNVSYDVYASEVSVSSVQSEETVTESDTDNSGDAMAVDADNSVETSASDEEITSSTETSYEAEDKTATSNASNDEAVTEAEATETKATETETTETETTETETETETTEIETIELDKKASDGELTGVTVENMSFSFSGFEAKLSDDTTVTIANPDDYRWVSFYLVQYKDDEELYERWCSFNGDNGVYKNSSTSFVLSKDTTHVALRVEASDKFGEVLEFTSDKIARTNKAEDVKFTISDVSTSISRLDATINYTGDMKFSDDISNAYFDVTLYYGTSDDQNEWSRLASGFSASRYKNENHSIYFSGLEGGKTYHGRIVVSLNAGYYSENTSYGFYQEIYLDDFTTKPDGTIDFQTAFPDKNFRTAVVNRLGDSSLSAEDETIAKSKLEKLTELNCYNSNSENVITSIKGIDLLTNVTYIDLQNNEIEDASEGIDWSKLTKLKSLYLNGNNLTKVPDFSKNENLTYLNLKENLLTDEVIAGIKTPSGCTVYTDDQRVGGFRLIAEDNYYIYNGASHLFVKPTGCKSDSSISYKFYVDDSTEELSMTKYSSDYYYNRNTGLLEGPHTIKVVMFKNGVESDSATAAFNVVKQGVFAEKEKYYVASSAANDNSNYITLNLYTDDLKANIDKVELVDKNGNVYADCTGAAQYTTNSDPRYTKFYYYANNILQHCNVRMEILKNSIPAGDYNIVITYKDGTSDKLENLVNVTSDMVITDIYGGYDNDMTGDYIFLSLQGSGINPEKLDYSFTYNNVEYSATYVSYKPTSSGVLVKLKKDASMPNKNNMSVTVNITPKNGNTAYITQATNKIYLNTGIFWLAYNQATNQFETGISAILGRDGTVEAELWSGIPFYDNNVKLATAKSVLNDDGIAYFTFLNDDGSEWFPTESKSYYVYCTYKGDTSYDSTWVSVSNYSTSINYWSGYSKYLAGTGNTTFHYYEGATYSKTDTYESVITGDNLSSELKTTVKTSDYSDSTTGTKVVLVEQKYDLSKLAVGKYTITLKKNEEVLSTKSLTIMPNKFILDYFYASWQDDNTISIYLSSPNFEDGDNNYTVTLIDPTGKKVENLTTKLDSGYANSYLYLKVTGLEKSDAYRKYYIKITHKTLGDAVKEDGNGEYTNYFTNDKGEYTTINSSSGGYTGTYKDGAYRYIGINTKNLTYPIQLSVYRPYDATKIVDLTIKAANSGDNYYYWSAAEVYNKLPDKDDLYDLVAVDANGKVITATEGLIWYRTTSNSSSSDWSFTTSSSQLEIGDNATITVSGNKKAPTFKPVDESIVTVTSKGNTATITAVGAGTTEIAITADGNTKTVTITVAAAEISAISFDKTTLDINKTGDSDTLSIRGDKQNGEVKNLVVTSSDENVATAQLAGKSGNAYELAKVNITAKGAGTATITATAEGLDPIEITVTVNGEFSEDEQTAKVNAVGNIYVDLSSATTLADVALTENSNWAWSKPATKLTTDRTSYEAVYTEDGYEPFTANLTVYSYELKGITLSGNDKLNKGATGQYELSYTITGTIDPALKAVWSTTDALQIVSSDNEKAEVKATTETEKQQTISVTVGKCSATVGVTVYAENIVTDITVTAQSATDNGIGVRLADTKAYVESTFISDSENSFVLTATGNVASPPLKWTSDNSEVAEVTEDGVVTVKKADSVKLTVTADDEAKFSKTIVLEVGDFAPKFEGTKLTVYKETNETSLPIYVNAANPVNGVAVDSDKFDCKLEDGNVIISVKDDKLTDITKKTQENVTFTFITELGEYPIENIAVTIDTTVPSVKFKQSGKLNTFYKNGTATFSVTSKNQIEDIKASADDKSGYTADFDGSTLTLTNLTDTSVKLDVIFKDYGTLTQNVTIATENKTPSLAINAATIVGEQTNVTTSVIDKKTKAAVTAEGLTVQPVNGIADAKIDENGNLTVICTAGTNTTYTVNVGSDDWNGTVSLTGKVTYAKNPKVVFGSKAAIITSIAQKSVVPVSIKDSSAKITRATVASKKTVSNLEVYFDADSQSIVAEYTGEVKKGSYSYTIIPYVDDTPLKATTLKVNVLAANQSASVTFKTKGTINLVNANEYITLTPTLKNTTANVKNIELTGDNADQFTIEPLGNGTYKLSYDDELVAGLEATQYTLTANVTLDDGTSVPKDIKVKPVIKLPKVKADVTKATLYTNSDKAFTANLTTTSKTGSNAIERIELSDDRFNVDFVPNEITPSNGKVTISLSDTDEKIPAGKYTLTCKVYYKSGAAGDINPATVKFTVTVK